MKRALLAAPLLALGATGAAAGGLDRSLQPIALIFSEGNYAEFGFSRTIPNIGGTGVGIAPFPPFSTGLAAGTSYSSVGGTFNIVTGGVKFDLSEDLSAAILVENPWAADIRYGGDPATTELGGTRALASSEAITAVLRWRFDDAWSAHGGLRIQRARGQITLNGRSYNPRGIPNGGVDGYEVDLADNTALGWLAGVAYERPEIALRVALTYYSAVTHDFDTTESGPLIDPDGPLGPLPPLPLLDGSSVTEVSTPQAVNLDFQTGIAPDTLLFGQVRWAQWSEFLIDPELFETVTGVGLVDLDDTITWTLGVGRRFDETWAGSVSVAYEEGSDPLVSPLAPTNGFWALGLGGSYALNETTTLSAGLRYTWLADAMPETGTPDVARADFTDNDALTFGVKIGFAF
jgi:long-subunit fatty acid transport protein